MTAYVYRVYDADTDELLYVGKSIDPKKRVKYGDGWSYAELANAYGVDESLIWAVLDASVQVACNVGRHRKTATAS